MGRIADQYFEMLETLDHLRAARKIDELLQGTDRTIPLLPALASEFTTEFGSFDVRSLPVIDLLRRFAPLRSDHARIERARSILEADLVLRPFLSEVERADRSISAVQLLRQHLGSHSHVRQAGLARSLGLDGREVAGLLRDLELDGQLVRQRIESTYELQLLPEKSPPPMVDVATPDPMPRRRWTPPSPGRTPPMPSTPPNRAQNRGCLAGFVSASSTPKIRPQRRRPKPRVKIKPWPKKRRSPAPGSTEWARRRTARYQKRIREGKSWRTGRPLD